MFQLEVFEKINFHCPGEVTNPKIQLSFLIHHVSEAINQGVRYAVVQLRILDDIQSENTGKPEPDQKSFEKVFIKWRQQGSENNIFVVSHYWHPENISCWGECFGLNSSYQVQLDMMFN